MWADVHDSEAYDRALTHLIVWEAVAERYDANGDLQADTCQCVPK
jgi:hypothetical protein